MLLNILILKLELRFNGVTRCPEGMEVINEKTTRTKKSSITD